MLILANQFGHGRLVALQAAIDKFAELRQQAMIPRRVKPGNPEYSLVGEQVSPTIPPPLVSNSS